MTWTVTPLQHPVGSDHRRVSLTWKSFICIAHSPTLLPISTPSLSFLRPECLLIQEQALLWNASPSPKDYLCGDRWICSSLYSHSRPALSSESLILKPQPLPSAIPLCHWHCSLILFSALASTMNTNTLSSQKKKANFLFLPGWTIRKEESVSTDLTEEHRTSSSCLSLRIESSRVQV